MTSTGRWSSFTSRTPPGFQAQTRYLPIYDRDINRSFPGSERSNTAERMAHQIYTRFISQCALGLDFHTSTRNRTTMFHIRADLQRPEVEELATAFGTNVVLSGEGDEGTLRTVATRDGTPRITVEMGKAHRFQPGLIEQALVSVESVRASYDIYPPGTVTEPAWRKVIWPAEGKRWIRSDEGGLVEMLGGPNPLVHGGNPSV